MNSNMHLPKDDTPHDDIFTFDVGGLLDEAFGNNGTTYNGSQAKTQTESSLCPECAQSGRESSLELYQVNFGEAIYMCPHPTCTYPMKEEKIVDNFIIKRDSSTIEQTRNTGKSNKKIKKKTLDSCEAFFKDFDIDSLLDLPEEPQNALLNDQRQPSDEQQGTSSNSVVNVVEDLVANSNDVMIAEENIKNETETTSKEEAHSVVSEQSDMREDLTDHSILTNKPLDTAQIEKPDTNQAENVVLPGIVPVSIQESNETAHDCVESHFQTEEMHSESVQPESMETNEDVVSDEHSNVAISDSQKSEPIPLLDTSLSSICSMNDKVANVGPEECEMPVLVDATSSNADDTLPHEEENEQPSDNDETSPITLPLPLCNKEAIQWTNESNSCWLDSMMTCLVNSVNLRAILNSENSYHSSLLRELCSVYDHCQQMYQDNIKNCSKDIMSAISERMGVVRGKVMKLLRKKVNFAEGGFQGMLEMFPVMLKACPEVEKYFKVHTLWHFECDQCNHERARRSSSHVVSFPCTSNDFHPLNACFERPCFRCNKKQANMTMMMEKLPPCLIFHFQNGLPHSNFRVLDFGLQGSLYSVFAVVQYVLRPVKHFITWIRNPKTNKWLCCNDLEGPICRWQQKQPRIPPGEIHMVMWERQSVSDPVNFESSGISVVVNHEANNVADEIPLESFYEYENDDTIVVPEDVIMHNMNSVKNGDAPSMQNQPILSSVTTENTKPLFSEANGNSNAQVENGNNHHHFQTIQVPVPQNNHVPGVLASNGISLIPTSNGTQTIQVVAPSNTCNIVIVMSDNNNQQQVVYNTPPSLPMTPVSTSFLKNNHSHSSGKRPRTRISSNEFSAYKPKRQFKLSGYTENQSFVNKFKFSPLRVSTTRKTTKTSTAPPTKPKAETRMTKKSDSEKSSEISELSDLLPDFDVRSHCSGDSNVSAPGALKRATATPPPSLNSSTSPSAWAPYSKAHNGNPVNLKTLPEQKDESEQRNDEASAELFFLSSFSQ